MSDRLNDDQADLLTGGGDCFLHYHSADRELSDRSLRQIQQLTTVREVTGDYTVTSKDYVVVVDDGDVVLPTAKNGVEFIIVNGGSTSITVTFSGGDTLFGTTSATIATLGDSLRFKGLKGKWITI